MKENVWEIKDQGPVQKVLQRVDCMPAPNLGAHECHFERVKQVILAVLRERGEGQVEIEASGRASQTVFKLEVRIESGAQTKTPGNKASPARVRHRLKGWRSLVALILGNLKASVALEGKAAQ